MTFHFPSGRLRALLAAGGIAFLAIACGGGVGAGGTGSPAAASFAQGSVTGFGSVVVGGVHFDERSAAIADEDGNVRGASDLHLGSTVDVLGGPVVDGAARADSIVIRIDLLGTVTTAWNPATSTLGVLGQPVRVNAATALDAFAGGAAGIAAGRVVAVSSFYDPASGVYVATRIEPRDGAQAFAVRGVVAALDPAARRFAIGTQAFDYAAAVPPAGLANGQLIRALLQPAPGPDGAWVVTGFGAGSSLTPDRSVGELEGVVGTLADATYFTVAGIPVDASMATVLPAGLSVSLRSRVEVHGQTLDGTLHATEVTIEALDDDDDGGGPGGGEFEIDGTILTAVDAVGKTFGMRGPTTVRYDQAAFEDGTAADLATGAHVEVKGRWSTDGTQLVASRIKFEH